MNFDLRRWTLTGLFHSGCWSTLLSLHHASRQAGMSADAISPSRQPTMALCAPIGKADDSGPTCRPVKDGCSLHSASAQRRRLASEALIWLGSTGVDVAIMPLGSRSQMVHRKLCRASRVRETLSIPNAWGTRRGVLLPIRHCNVSGPLGGQPVQFLCCWDRGSHESHLTGRLTLLLRSMTRNWNAAAVASRKQV